MRSSIHIITASTSGNTDMTADVISERILEQAPSMKITRQRAEEADAKDLERGDLLILGSGTWNTGGKEGQLNMHMHTLLMERARDVMLPQKNITFISLGDDRYYFTTRCTEHFLRFQRERGARLFHPPFILVNDPYGQEEKMKAWADKLLRTFLTTFPV